MRYLTTFLLAACVTFAQTPPDRDKTPGFWTEWKWYGTASADDAASPAGLRSLGANVRQANEVVRATPVVAEPIGFDAQLVGSFVEFRPHRSDLKARDFPLAAKMWFGAFPQHFDKDGTRTRELGETAILDFFFNVLPTFSKPEDWNRKVTTDVFLEPRPLPDLAGFPYFEDALIDRGNDDLLVVKRNPRPSGSPSASRTP